MSSSHRFASSFVALHEKLHDEHFPLVNKSLRSRVANNAGTILRRSLLCNIFFSQPEAIDE